MVRPGDVVVVNFAGATMTKGRPMIVISGSAYHHQRPDVIVGLLTTNLTAARSSSDYILQDWKQAGFRKPSAFQTTLARKAKPTFRLLATYRTAIGKV